MITWVLDNVDSDIIEATFILLILKEQQDKNDLISQLTPLKARMKFVIVDQVTEGAACTALLAKEHIDNDVPLFIANSDQFIEWDASSFWKDRAAANEKGVDGDVLCFDVPMENNDTKWSYAAVDEEGYITDLKEKIVISRNATVGMYYWAKGSDFVESAEAMIAANDRSNGEFYVAPAYIYGIKANRKYTVSFCSNMWGLGVPHDLTTFLSDYSRPNIKAIANGAGDDVAKKHYGRTSGSLIFIAHRGNVDGPNPSEENKPEYLLRALSMGFDVEVDAWLDPETMQWALGHDAPTYPIEYDFLLTPGFWIHAKNCHALQAMVHDTRIHCFTHDQDEYTLTSQGVIWAYPNVNLAGKNCIAVMYSNPERLIERSDIGGICHDIVGPLRKQYIASRLNDDTVCPTSRRIRLVVFDLDGVLVESRDLHYEALNRALEEEAGKECVISREEHTHVYDGLSTNQKLKMLEVAKGLPSDLHQNVWDKKQAYTESLVNEMLGPLDHILNTITALKKMSLPVCVASNCIRSSVKTILTQIGLMPYVDVFLSNEDVKNAKPNPDIYEKACSIFGVSPSETLVVEDSTIGFEAASRAGCHMLRVSNPHDVTESSVKSRIQELECLTEEVTIVLPLAGPYPEIWQAREASEMPLYLTDVSGESVLELIGKSLSTRRYVANYIFVVKEAVSKAYDVDALCAKAVDYAPLKIVKTKTDTLSSLHTILQIPAEYIPDNVPLLVADGHHIPVWKDGESLDNILGSHSAGALTVVQATNPRFSYVRLSFDKRSKEGPSRVVEVAMEGRPTSDLACSGLYYFKRASDLREAAKTVIGTNQRWLGRFFTAQLYNELVQNGLEVEALQLKNYWSLRTVDEIERYKMIALPAIAVSHLDEIYDEMIERQTRYVTKSCIKYDTQLSASDMEPLPGRRCYAVYSMCDTSNWKPTVAFSQLMDKVKAVIGENHCFYKATDEHTSNLTGTLHWTFLQLIGFNLFDKVDIDQGYGDVIEGNLLRHLPRVKITFSRLVVAQGSIMLLGYPTSDVNNSRFHLRRSLTRCGLPLFEPFLNDIVHMTLVRFASPIDASTVAELQKTVDEFSGVVSFGSFSVNELRLSPATWKMQPQELATYQDETRVIKLL